MMDCDGHVSESSTCSCNNDDDNCGDDDDDDYCGHDAMSATLSVSSFIHPSKFVSLLIVA